MYLYNRTVSCLPSPASQPQPGGSWLGCFLDRDELPSRSQVTPPRGGAGCGLHSFTTPANPQPSSPSDQSYNNKKKKTKSTLQGFHSLPWGRATGGHHRLPSSPLGRGLVEASGGNQMPESELLRKGAKKPNAHHSPNGPGQLV